MNLATHYNGFKDRLGYWGNANEKTEIRVDAIIKTDIQIKNNRLDSFIYDNKIILIKLENRS